MALILLARLKRINRVCALGAGVLLLLCAALVLLDIVLRQWGRSLGGTDEISGYVMAIATAWGMAFALLELSHVRIDLLRSRGPSWVRAAFDLLALGVLAAVITLLAWHAWPVLARSIANSSHANTPLETPLAWVQWPWFLGWAWFALVAWLTWAAAVVLVWQRQWVALEAAVGSAGEGQAS